MEAFGEEWSKFDHADLDNPDLQTLFQSYFSIFPWHELPPNAEGFDLGCGTGRWAHFVAQRVGFLHCIDPSAAALDVARRNLQMHSNCSFHCASVEEIPLADSSADFGYSLGVLHHIPDTQLGITECARKLKPGAPLADLSVLRLRQSSHMVSNASGGSPIWSADASALFHSPSDPLFATSLLHSSIGRWRAHQNVLEKMGVDVDSFPLSSYRNRSFYSMRTDALDRFGTRLEKRFTRKQIAEMMENAGFERIVFSDSPCWCAIGYRKQQPL